MKTNINKIQMIAEEKRDENLNFRSFLKGTHIKNLDSIVNELFKQFSEAIDCTTCGNCCKVIVPSLSENDINKLAKSLNITKDQFTASYVKKDDFNGSLKFNKTPCPFLSNNKCTQYDFRPAACVSFPYIYKKGFVSKLIGVVNSCAVCPIVFNVYEALKTELNYGFRRSR